CIGYVLASAFTLLFLSIDIETVHHGFPIDFKLIAALGSLIIVITGLCALLFGVPFLSQTFTYINLPIFGISEITTVTFFEIGVALTVVGVVVTIILSISGDV